MELDKMDFKGQERIRLVPFRGINKGGQFMLAIKPDQVRFAIMINGSLQAKYWWVLMEVN